MKKRVSWLLALILLFCSLGSFTAAADTKAEKEIRGTVLSEKVEYFANGSSVMIIVAEEPSITPYGRVYVKTDTRSCHVVLSCDKNGVLS